MNLKYSSQFLIGAAALALGAPFAFAQATSARRIPISKEAPAPRVDTVTVYHTDTIQVAGPTMYVHDTVRVDGPTRYVHDTVTRLERPPVRLPNGFYAGVAGGASVPDGALFVPNSTGWTGQGQFGWQRAKQFVGARADINYARPGEDSQFSSAQGDASIINYSADIKMQLPLFNHIFGLVPRFALYGIGGYTYTMYKNLPMRLNTGFVASDPDWNHHGGWNLGGGASLGWGRTELFLETRQLAFDASNATTSRQWPTVFGINFY